MSETLNIKRKEQILNTASILFKERGYASTSMRDIAAGLNMEAASLYHHIKSKEEILEIICFGMAQKFLNPIAEVNDIYFNAEEKLRMAIKNHVYNITSNQEQSAVFLNEWRYLAEPALTDFKELRNHYENEFTHIIKSGINENVFEAVDHKFAALSILGSLNWINQWYNPAGKMNSEEISLKIGDFILGGLRKKFVTDPNYKP
ncbi:MAG: TetR/AcrR family transcriptional regulator [Bacteroidota bacterium]|nr:TetR/AcrR family transcriptional regulator [Bacteroidota bacterium]